MVFFEALPAAAVAEDGCGEVLIGAEGSPELPCLRRWKCMESLAMSVINFCPIKATNLFLIEGG